jgi:hypothetical protein
MFGIPAASLTHAARQQGVDRLTDLLRPSSVNRSDQSVDMTTVGDRLARSFSTQTCNDVFDAYLAHCAARLAKLDLAYTTLASYRRVIDSSGARRSAHDVSIT